MYRTLDAGKITATIDLLKARIDERLPRTDLAGVAEGLSAAARDTQMEALALARPMWGLRLLLVLFVPACLAVALAVAQRFGGHDAGPTALNTEATNLLQTLEATINTIVLGGAALIFLATVEHRLKRHRALKALHQLRSLIHVIDMHQLTKDPSLVLGKEQNTSTSPKRTMSPFELGRYLDYCSEMLSLTGKVAALYAQNFHDPVVITAVNDLEMLATNLSGKIWQKIAILQAAIEDAQEADRP